MNLKDGFQRGTKKDSEYRVEVSKTKIKLICRDERAAAQASYLLEDLMNLEEALYVRLSRERRVPLLPPPHGYIRVSRRMGRRAISCGRETAESTLAADR